VTDGEVRAVQDRLNGRPRKALGYRTPAEVFHKAGLPEPPAPRGGERRIFRARPPRGLTPPGKPV